MSNVPSNQQATRFFISYAHADLQSEELAKSLCTRLRVKHFEAFIDSDITIGTDWVEEIESRISQSDFFVVFLSEKALKSEMLQAEVRLAHRRKKESGHPRILPIRIGQIEQMSYELDSYLGRLQWRNWDERSELLDEIIELVSYEGSPGIYIDTAKQPPTQENADPRRPLPIVDPRIVTAPGGTLSADDPFYIERDADQVVKMRSAILGQTLVIKAPRQMGKSSLLLRYLQSCKKRRQDIALMDFSCFTDSDLTNYGQLLSDILGFLVKNFHLTFPSPRIERQLDLTYFIEDLVLPSIPDGGVIAFDEVDRVLGKPFQKDFFSMIRLWHNKRALSFD
jgi:AAA-like domain/TIR domain